MSLQTVAEDARQTGVFPNTRVDELAQLAAQAHGIASKLDNRYLRLTRGHPVGLAVLVLATWYGEEDGYGTRSEFGLPAHVMEDDYLPTALAWIRESKGFLERLGLYDSRLPDDLVLELGELHGALEHLLTLTGELEAEQVAP